MELEWPEEGLRYSAEAERAMIEAQNPELRVRLQCETLGLNCTTLTYEATQESALYLGLVRRTDAQCLKTPFYGYRRMTVSLRRQGYAVNPKRV